MKQGSIIVKYLLKLVALFQRKLYVPSMTHYSTIKYDDIVAYASKAAGIQEADMYATMSAIYDAFDYFICNGHSFKLDGVGTFSLALNAQAGLASAADTKTGAAAVRRVGINFLPDEKLKSLLANVAINVEADNQGQPEDPSPMLLSMGINGQKFFDKETTSSPQVAPQITEGTKIELTGYNLDAFGSIKVNFNSSQKEFALKVSDDGTEAVAVLSGIGSGQSISSIVVGSTTYSFSSTSEVIGELYIDGLLFKNGGTIGLGKHKFMVKGYNLNVQQVTFGNQVVTPTLATSTRYEFEANIQAATQSVLNFNGELQFTVNSAAGYPDNVLSITANGVEVLNGQLSTVARGLTYHFVVLGWNLANERYGGAISLPAGCVKSNYKYSQTRITFDMQVTDEADNGTIKIGNYFEVEVSVSNLSIPSVGVAYSDSATTFAAATLITDRLANNGNVGSIDLPKVFVKVPNADEVGFDVDNVKVSGTATTTVTAVASEPGVFCIEAYDGTADVRICDDPSQETTLFLFHFKSTASANAPGE